MLQIRKTKKSDVVSLGYIRNEPDIYINLRQKTLCTPEKQLAWFDNALKDTSRIDFTILISKDIAGSVLLRDIDFDYGHAEVGWFLKKKYRGNGYGKKAVKKMLDFAFREINLNSVYAYVYEDNIVGQSFAISVGMKKVGLLRNRRWREKKFVGEIVYDLISEDYL